MILTCPDCATRYFVEDARIGPQGRKVRCASCGTTWREGAQVDAPSLSPDKRFGVGADQTPEDGRLDAVRDRLAKAPDAPKRIRQAAVEKRQTREAVAVGVVWAGLGAGFCALALVAVLFRTDVVRLAPATAGAYAFARMPVNPTGLAIEGVQGGPGLKDGHAALTVSGVERNVETRAREATPLRVLLLDKVGKRLANRVVTPQGGTLKPGETRPFSVSFLDPPLAAASFQVEFAFDAAKRHAATTAPSAPLSLRGPTGVVAGAALPAPVMVSAPVGAKEAAPLPAGSPYALPAVSDAGSPQGGGVAVGRPAPAKPPHG